MFEATSFSQTGFWAAPPVHTVRMQCLNMRHDGCIADKRVASISSVRPLHSLTTVRGMSWRRGIIAYASESFNIIADSPCVCTTFESPPRVVQLHINERIMRPQGKLCDRRVPNR